VPQAVSPTGQAATQVPAAHARPEAHALPQAPQLAGSVATSTHAPLQEVVPVLQPASGATQTLLLQVHPLGQSLVVLQVISTLLLQLAPSRPTMTASAARHTATTTRRLLVMPPDGALAIGSR